MDPAKVLFMPAMNSRRVVLKVTFADHSPILHACTAEQLKDARVIARAMTDKGATASLRWAPDCLPGTAHEEAVRDALALADAHSLAGRAVAFRVIELEGDGVCVWVLVDCGNGRGYLVAWNPAWAGAHGLDPRELLLVTSSPVKPGRYQLGLARLRACEVAEGGTIVQDWTEV